MQERLERDKCSSLLDPFASYEKRKCGEQVQNSSQNWIGIYPYFFALVMSVDGSSGKNENNKQTGLPIISSIKIAKVLRSVS
jgi:hypothetical protein